MDADQAKDLLKKNSDLSKKIRHDAQDSLYDIEDVNKKLEEVWSKCKSSMTKGDISKITKAIEDKGMINTEQEKIQSDSKSYNNFLGWGHAMLKKYLYCRYRVYSIKENHPHLMKYQNEEEINHVLEAAETEYKVSHTLLNELSRVNKESENARKRLTVLGHSLTADFADPSQDMAMPDDPD